jgi:type I restriction enzyme S subunit
MYSRPYYLAASKGGSVQEIINTSIIKDLIIPVPDLETQKSIVKKLNSLSIEIKKLETIYQQKLDDLDELKKSILQKAFNGELTEKVLSDI